MYSPPNRRSDSKSWMTLLFLFSSSVESRPLKIHVANRLPSRYCATGFKSEIHGQNLNARLAQCPKYIFVTFALPRLRNQPETVTHS